MKGLVLFSKNKSQLTKSDYTMMRILEASEKNNIDLDIITPSQFELIVTRDDKKSILIDDKETQLPDFVIPRLGSNTNYYALAVIRQLEHLGIYVANKSSSIEAVKDKLHMHQLLAHSNLPTPKTMLARFPIEVSVVSREIGFPLIIKNVTGTEGRGIYLCKNEQSFLDVMELVYSNNVNANIIIQEFIESSHGRDLRVFVLGGRVIGCIQRSSSDSFKANFSRGASVSHFELTPEIESLSVETAKLLKLDITGIDLLFNGDTFKICEANSSPNFHGLEKVTGQHIAEDIIDYIKSRVGHI